MRSGSSSDGVVYGPVPSTVSYARRVLRSWGRLRGRMETGYETKGVRGTGESRRPEDLAV